MYNLLISLAVGAVLFAAVAASGFSPWAGILPAVIGVIGAYFLLARRILKKVQDVMMRAQKDIVAAQGGDPKQVQAKIDKAVQVLGEAFQYEKWQFFVAGAVHANIGYLQYMLKDFEHARPHLEKATPQGPMGARAKMMLACLSFMKKDEVAMRASFEVAVKAGKKEPIVWAAYAWCLDQLDKRDDALRVLARAVEANPSDEKLKAGMSALQNEKKFKMKAYAPEWYQYHLEKPPADMMMGPGGRRVVFQRR